MIAAVLFGCASAPDPVPVEACGETAPVALARTPTWSDDVAPLVAENCASCHVDHGIAPFPLTDYADAAQWAEAMAEDVKIRKMPPFPPRNCADCNTFRDARWLSSEQIATIVAWADAGAPEGTEGTPFPK